MVSTWSLFCWLYTMPEGPELDMVRAQVAKRAGIFACDDFQAYSLNWISLGPNIHANPVFQTGKSAVGFWGSWENTDNFVAAWDSVMDEGRYKQHGWTVKVDPDCVFFSGRLRAQLQWAWPDGNFGRAYVQNWQGTVSLYGPVEAISSEAIAYWESHRAEAVDCYADHSGEDGWIHSVLDSLQTSSKQNHNVISQFGPCNNDKFAGYHPHKDAGAWFDCWYASGGGSP